MLLYSGLCDEYVKCLKKLRYFVGNNVEWNPLTSDFRLKTSPFKRTMCISFLFFVFQSLHITLQPEADRSSIDSFWIVFAAMFAFIVFCSFEMIRNKDVIERLINGLVSFEKRHCKAGHGLTFQDKKRLKSAKRTCSLLSNVGFGPVGVALGLISILLPKSVLNVLSYPPGSWLINWFDVLLHWLGLHSILVWTLVKIVVVLGNLYVFTVNYGSGVNLCNQIITATLSLSIVIRIFDRRLKALTTQSRNAMDVNKFTEQFQKSIKIYREIQLLTGYFNQSHSLVLVSMVITAITGQVVSVVGLLRKDDNNKLDTPTSMFLRLFYVEGGILTVVCINFIFGFWAYVYADSKRCIDSLNL